MQSSLHQHTSAAECDRLVDLFANLIHRAHVRVGRAGAAIECAERADDVADVRVIDVAIDDVGDDVIWMTTLTNLIRGGSDGRDVVRPEQRGTFLDAHTLAVESLVQDRSCLAVRHRIKSSNLRNNTQSAASKELSFSGVSFPRSGNAR